jgi:membrane-associated protease RseP (regulator of RpoE activity)
VSSYPSPDSSTGGQFTWPGSKPSYGIPTYPAPRWREWVVPGFLFLLTLLSTTYAGLLYVIVDAGFLRTILWSIEHPQILRAGLPFSLTFLGILLSHELGHFFACRYYGIRCTPPYFLPLPISIAGTLGAFIRIKSPFPNKKALFDVGIAGPLAGFVIVVPALFLGISQSRLVPRGSLGAGGFSFGEPLIFKWIGHLVLGYTPATQDMVAHPVALAAWFGLLATCLNLFPIWQLDGGHIAYAVLGPVSQKKLSVACAAALIIVSFAGWPVPSYLLFGAMLLILGFKYRFYHPPTVFEHEDIGPARRFLSGVALMILIISFTPVPITLT